MWEQGSKFTTPQVCVMNLLHNHGRGDGEPLHPALCKWPQALSPRLESPRVQGAVLNQAKILELSCILQPNFHVVHHQSQFWESELPLDSRI